MTELGIAPLAPPLSQSATQQVFGALYKAVISLQLPPGTKVSEAEVAKQLDVSRQPVRDSFFRLSQLGFLSIRPQRATLITKISERAVLNAIFIRIAIEAECMRELMQRLTDADVKRLRLNLVRQEQALEAPDPSGFHGLDEEFHEMLCDISGNGHAWSLIQEQKAHMDRIRYLSLSEERRRMVLSEHSGIIDALDRRDMESAEANLRAHLANIKPVLPRIRQAHPDYFEASQ